MILHAFYVQCQPESGEINFFTVIVKIKRSKKGMSGQSYVDVLMCLQILFHIQSASDNFHVHHSIGECLYSL